MTLPLKTTSTIIKQDILLHKIVLCTLCIHRVLNAFHILKNDFRIHFENFLNFSFYFVTILDYVLKFLNYDEKRSLKNLLSLYPMADFG